MTLIKKAFSSLLLLIGLCSSAIGQESTDYKYYTLSSLVGENKDFGNELMVFLYKNIEFPKAFREAEFEGSITIFLKCDEKRENEILYTDLVNEEFKLVYENIDTLDWASIKPIENRMLIEIPIEFDLEPFNRREVARDSVVILAYKIPSPDH